MRWLAAIVALAGCHSTATAPPPETIVTLQDPGKAPLRALAYHPVAHDRTATIMGMEGMTTVLAWSLDDATAGALHYRFKLADLRFPGKVDPDEREVIDGLIGKVTGSVGADEHGRATAVNDSQRYHLSPSIPDLTSMLIVPFPTAAIGAGAKWTATGHITPGQPVTAKLVYELVKLEADVAYVSWTGSYDADTGEKLADVDGSATVRFDDLLPFHGRVRQRFPVPGKAAELTFVLD